MSQHNFYLDIINIYNDVYKNEIPLSHEDGKGTSIIIRNNDNNQDDVTEKSESDSDDDSDFTSL